MTTDPQADTSLDPVTAAPHHGSPQDVRRVWAAYAISQAGSGVGALPPDTGHRRRYLARVTAAWAVSGKIAQPVVIAAGGPAAAVLGARTALLVLA